MKKSIALAATAVSLLVVGIALAAQVNVYGVTGGTSPSKGGTKAKPVPTSVLFNYTVDEQSGNRPAAVKTYDIKFANVRVNQSVVKTSCTADQINSTGDPASVSANGAGDADDTAQACGKAQVVGTGYADNNVGQDVNEKDQSLHCYLYVKIYNGKPGHATLFLYGHKNPDGSISKNGDKFCVIEVATGIDMTYKKSGNTAILSFTVPSKLLHNIPGFTTAVRKVESTIKKITGKIHGHTHGYYESIGCSGGKRLISVVFTPETGAAQTAKYNAKCTK